MRIVVCPADGGACGAYRLRWPAEALAAEGVDVEVRYGNSGIIVEWDRSWEGLEAPPPWVRVVGLRSFDADVVVIQRPARRWWADIIPHLQAAGVRVVVDIDDRLDRVHRDNVAADHLDPAKVDWHNHRWADLACRRADAVTVTTPALLRRYGYGHGTVLPNLVPEAYLSVQVAKRERTVGWTGTVQTHPGDLEVTGGAVGRAVASTGWGFHVVGSGEGVADRLRLAGEPSATGWVTFGEYPERYAELEVAVVPLADNPFNEAKSALKASEAAALGVPVVMSPTPDNVRLHGLGVGLVASSPNQWRRHVERLCRSEGLREEMAGKGREVMAGWTYERRAERWLAVWAGEQRARSVA